MLWAGIGFVAGLVAGCAAFLVVAVSVAQSNLALRVSLTGERPRLNVLQQLLLKLFILVWALIAAAGGGER